MNYQMSATQIAEENARFMAKVYRWMSGGILITGLVSYSMSQNEQLMLWMMANRMLFFGLILVQLGLVAFLSFRIQKMSATTATLTYLGYATLTGVTLSSIFLIYTQASIQSAFFTTACAFAGLSIFGYFTKRDLGPIGSFCTMGVFGLIGFSLLSLFFPSIMGGTAEKVYGIGGIIIFAGLTAYDTQKIKNINIIGNEGTAEDHKEAIFGALTLYLDFINLFLFILRMMGDRRR